MRMNQDEIRFDFHGLGLAIKQAREERGWTQAYVAELVGKTERTIMNIENKGQHPSFNLFFKLVTMFDISVDQFFYREEQRDEHSCRKHIDVLLNSMNEKEQVVDSFSIWYNELNKYILWRSIMPALPYSITISDEERAYLKSLIKTRTIQAQVVDRARMLLWKSEAKTDKAIADGLGVSVNTVRRCIDRYLNNGINLAIFDDERSGRPAEITDDAKSWIVSIACQKPCDLGYAAELWTLAALHKHIQAHAEEAGYPRLKTVTKPWL